MKRIRKSLGFALEGFIHAMKIEKNLQLFVPIYLVVLIVGGFLRILEWEWLALILSGGLFMATELLNTALERLSDVLDEERKLLGRRSHHFKMKATKDVGAAASLMSLITIIAVVCVVFGPYVNIYVLH